MAFAALTLGLATLVGALALTSRQASPPTISEFAPQAVEQITDTSQDVAGRRGGASGESSSLDEVAAENGSALQSVDVARVRQCVGDPPRQIEDPQSPPCVPYWSGDNGGATWRGVTRDEIRVTDAHYATNPALVAFFNRRFEFYGRQIRRIPRQIPPSENPAGQRAAARSAYEQDQAFASTGVAYDWDYFDELARLGIAAVHFEPLFPESYLAARRPYLWTYPMANDRIFATAGNWYCARFAGRNAVHAGDPVLQVTRRKPGIVLTQADWEGTSAEPMNAQLASCGERTDAVFRSTTHNNGFANADTASYSAFFENAMLQMKTSGVTTVACLCNVYQAGIAMRAATNQGYFPEWLLTHYQYNEAMTSIRVYQPQEQTQNLMLLLAHPMERPPADHPSNWALQEVSNASYPAGIWAQVGHDQTYRMLLLLASGFQMAGPHLTPETFERGLHQARFPNPAHRIMAGAVGFGDGDHSMTDDATEVWWSNSARTPYPDDPPGAFCYVDQGARRRMGAFPSDDPFFREPCDNGSS